MALFKRGKFWNYDFQFRKRRYQGTTYQTNKEEAAKWLRAKRTRLANGLVGLTDEGPQIPTLIHFLENDFTKHVEQQTRSNGTKAAYKKSIKRFTAAPCFQNKLLDQITDREISEYKQYRLAKGNTPATINVDLAVLRKALRWADRGLKLIHYNGVSSLPGANQRTFVIGGELEKEYLAVVPYPLKQVAVLMLDLGLRPEECVRLRKADCTDSTVTVTAGKTKNARRSLPQTERTLEVFKFMAELFPCRCNESITVAHRTRPTLHDMPIIGATTSRACNCFVFPGREGKHLTAHSVSNLHTITRKRFNESIAVATPITASNAKWAMKEPVVPAVRTQWPKEFILYSLRHTFATRFAESCNGDANLVMKALGHSSPLMSARYVHVQPDYMRVAFARKEMLDKAIRGEEVTHGPTSENADARVDRQASK